MAVAHIAATDRQARAPFESAALSHLGTSAAVSRAVVLLPAPRAAAAQRPPCGIGDRAPLLERAYSQPGAGAGDAHRRPSAERDLLPLPDDLSSRRCAGARRALSTDQRPGDRNARYARRHRIRLLSRREVRKRLLPVRPRRAVSAPPIHEPAPGTLSPPGEA